MTELNEFRPGDVRYEVQYEPIDNGRVRWIIRDGGCRTSGREDTMQLAKLRVIQEVKKLGYNPIYAELGI